MNYKERIKKLQLLLKNQSYDAIIIDDPLNIFYLTGQELSLGFLIIEKNEARLIVDNRYFESCQKKAPIPVLLLEENALKQALNTPPFDKIKTVAFDSQSTSYDKFLTYQETLQAKNIEFIPLKNPVLTLRSIKEKEEIEALKKAAILGSEGFDFVCSILKSGITELEVATELEIFWKRKGSKGLAFDSIIAFGENSSMPHYKPSTRKLKTGDPVLIDIGVNLDFYHSDMTRVVFFGEPSPKMKEIYFVVKKAQEAALELCKQAVTIAEIDKKARDLMQSYGLDQYFTHSLGHGVGLEIHELPVMRSKNLEQLEEGMVITIEPGIYLPDIGGVRIEDTIVIEKEGHINLTNRSKDLLILEP